MWWWSIVPPGWLLSLVNLGLMLTNGVSGGVVNVGPYISSQISSGGGGGGSAGSSNQLSSAIGDFSVSWVGVGIIIPHSSFPVPGDDHPVRPGR